ncbi:hypothetical protein FERRO_11390 [Ferrovum sp. JA12]|nr:hypothetical protein FERRO_11390 [Ferrovum sp. JA12]
MLTTDYIKSLRDQHLHLDQQIHVLMQHSNNELEIRRLKKLKLKLKDHIDQLERSQTPDIPA